MSGISSEEMNAAIAAAHNELAAAYSEDQIEVQQPIDDQLWRLARRVASAAVRTANHMVGTQGFYDVEVPYPHKIIGR